MLADLGLKQRTSLQSLQETDGKYLLLLPGWGGLVPQCFMVFLHRAALNFSGWAMPEICASVCFT